MSTVLANPAEVAIPLLPPRLRGDFKLCRNCKHALRDQAIIQSQDDAQMWACAECGLTRQWGFYGPWDRFESPILGCKRCECSTHHAFVGTVGKDF